MHPAMLVFINASHISLRLLNTTALQAPIQPPIMTQR